MPEQELVLWKVEVCFLFPLYVSRVQIKSDRREYGRGDFRPCEWEVEFGLETNNSGTAVPDR